MSRQRELVIPGIFICMHGDDFVGVLCWVLREKGLSGKVANPSVLG